LDCNRDSWPLERGLPGVERRNESNKKKSERKGDAAEVEKKKRKKEGKENSPERGRREFGSARGVKWTGRERGQQTQKNGRTQGAEIKEPKKKGLDPKSCQSGGGVE